MLSIEFMWPKRHHRFKKNIHKILNFNHSRAILRGGAPLISNLRDIVPSPPKMLLFLTLL